MTARPTHPFRPLPLALLGILMMLAATASARAAAPNEMAQVIRPIVAPGARAVAVNDALNLLAIGVSGDTGAKLLLFPLHGDQTGEPVTMDLPKDKALAAFASYPLALAFHPRLPLLYVWQDLRRPDTDDDKDAKDNTDAANKQAEADATLVNAHFDHLLIYRIDNGRLTPLDAACRGQTFAYAQPNGALAISPDATRLFMANLSGQTDADPLDKREQGAIGYFDLDEKGGLVPVSVPLKDSLDGQGQSRFEMQIRPTWVYTGHHRYRWVGPLPNGTGFVAPNARFLLFGTHQGLALWDTQNRGQALSEIALTVMQGNGSALVGGHPTLPVVYAATFRRDRLLRMEHIDGVPTAMPQTLLIPGAFFLSPPVVFLGPHPGLAVGAEKGQIKLIGLDAQGRLTNQIETVSLPIAAPPVMAWSAKAARLFVAVDKAAGQPGAKP